MSLNVNIIAHYRFHSNLLKIIVNFIYQTPIRNFKLIIALIFNVFSVTSNSIALLLLLLHKKAHRILFLRNPSINPMGFLMFYFFMFYFQKSYYNFMYFADIYPTTSLFLSLIRTLYQPFEVFPIMVTFVPLL